MNSPVMTLWPSQVMHASLRHAGRHLQNPQNAVCKPSWGRMHAPHPSVPSCRGSMIILHASVAPSTVLMTCKRCKQRFSEADNTRASCRYHPSLYTGGEVAKAIGFVRASDAPEDQLERVTGRKGLMRFWDCCGDEDEGAPGCCVGFHITFDEDYNEAKGWQ